VGATTKLDVLVGTGKAGPAETIVGAPGVSGYTNANNSITTGSHNPLLYETATWTLTEVGVTDSTIVTAVTFQGGTAEGSNLSTGTLTSSLVAPEPSTVGMMAGAGLLLVLSALRRRS
jgi:hypothetical protein